MIGFPKTKNELITLTTTKLIYYLKYKNIEYNANNMDKNDLINLILNFQKNEDNNNTSINTNVWSPEIEHENNETNIDRPGYYSFVNKDIPKPKLRLQGSNNNIINNNESTQHKSRMNNIIENDNELTNLNGNSNINNNCCTSCQCCIIL